MQDDLLELIKTSTEQIKNQRKIALDCNIDDEYVLLHNRMIEHFNKIESVISSTDLSRNYINQFQNNVNQAKNLFPYGQQNGNQLSTTQINQIKFEIEKQGPAIEKQLELLEFNFDFFNKLGFFKDNIVAIGANGSGKTTLSNELKKYLPENGVVISAQKVLIIPSFSGISNFDKTNKKLQSTQSADKSLKTTYSTENNGNAYQILVQLGGEFQILLDNLLAERSAIRNKFCDALNGGGDNIKVPKTKLDIALSIWNSMIEHRIIECNDGINITLKSTNSIPYPAHQMSDGEKVALYLIAQVLQAPKSGFIIVDEPEMYLHKTILMKLWDILEKERQDCIFVFLTHDLDFATSRVTSKKVWIRSFTYPNKWEIENIPENDLPEPLLLELLGSRKNILFCEGKKGSIDEKLFNILFPNFTITPVDNCFSVINYTKAFNKLPNLTTHAFGIIDSDHHGVERLSALQPEKIYSFSMTEPENLFFDEDFLIIFSKQLLHEENIIQKIKLDVIKKFTNELELQVSNYISAKINYYFKDSHVSKGNTLVSVSENYNQFTQEIKIKEWFDERKEELEKLITSNDYKKILSVYNNKGLKTIACRHLKISDFTEKSIKLLQFQPNTHKLLKKYFPIELTNENGL